MFVDPIHRQIFAIAHDKEIIPCWLIIEGHDPGIWKMRHKHILWPDSACLVMGPSCFGATTRSMNENYTKSDLKHKRLNMVACVATYSKFPLVGFAQKRKGSTAIECSVGGAAMWVFTEYSRADFKGNKVNRSSRTGFSSIQ